jgi:very-short-patch-repair endonuclease
MRKHIRPHLSKKSFRTKKATTIDDMNNYQSSAPAEKQGKSIQQTDLQEKLEHCMHECLRIRQHTTQDLVFTHLTAAALLGIEPPFPLPKYHDKTIHASVQLRGKRSEILGVTFHVWKNLSKEHVVGFGNGIRCTDAMTIWLQMASYLSLDELVVFGDSIMRAKPQISIADFYQATIDILTFRGKIRCLKAIPLMSTRSDSSQETRLRLLLFHARLPIPEVNYEIESREWGREAMRIDLAYPKQKVAIEYDGEQHFSDTVQRRRDARKRRILEKLGWKVIVVTKYDMKNHYQQLELCKFIERELGIAHSA